MPGKAGIRGDTVLFGIRLDFVADTWVALNIALSAVRGESDPDPAGKPVRITLSQYSVKPSPDHAEISGSRLSIARGGVWIEAEGATGSGHCHYLPADAAELPEMIETLALFLVAQAGRVPLHASAIMLDDVAVVLAGPSGAGKSSLALAASRAHIPVLAEDTVYIQTEPSLRLWSRLRAIHVFEKDAPAEQGALRLKNGRWKKALRPGAAIAVADRAILCLLARGERPALHRLDAQEAIARLTAAPEPGYDLYGSRAVGAVRALTEEGCWRLVLSQDPQAALALLVSQFAAPAHQTAFA